MAHTLDAADVDDESFCASFFADEDMPALEHVSAYRQVIGQASSSAADAGRAEAAKMAALVPPALPDPSASPSTSSAATTIPLLEPDPSSISSLSYGGVCVDGTELIVRSKSGEDVASQLYYYDQTLARAVELPGEFHGFLSLCHVLPATGGVPPDLAPSPLLTPPLPPQPISTRSRAPSTTSGRPSSGRTCPMASTSS